MIIKVNIPAITSSKTTPIPLPPLLSTSLMGKGFQMSKIRNNRKPVKYALKETGTVKTDMKKPIHSSKTISFASFLFKILSTSRQRKHEYIVKKKIKRKFKKGGKKRLMKTAKGTAAKVPAEPGKNLE